MSNIKNRKSLLKLEKKNIVETLTDVAADTAACVVQGPALKVISHVTIKTIGDTIARSLEQIPKNNFTRYQEEKAREVIERAKWRFEQNNTIENDSNSCAMDYVEHAFEIGYRIIQNAMLESQQKKLPILGDFWGNVVSKNHNDWDEYHDIADIIDGLTYRKLVLIKIINDGFNNWSGSHPNITDSLICVELNQLQQIGIWKSDAVIWGTDVTAALPIKDIKKTNLCSRLVSLLMLDENIPDEDISLLQQKMQSDDANEALDKLSKDDIAKPMWENEIEDAWNEAGKK